MMERLPDNVFMDMLLMLDGLSLHQCRQVCSKWDRFIQEVLWGTQGGRKRINLKLRNQWKHSKPIVKVSTDMLVDVNSTIGSKYTLLDVSKDICVMKKESEGDESLTLVIVKTDQSKWEVSVQSSQEGEEFSKAIILEFVIVGLTNVGTVVVWDRGNGWGEKGSEVHKEKYYNAKNWQNLCLQGDKSTLVLWNSVVLEASVIKFEYSSKVIKTKTTVIFPSGNPTTPRYLLDFSSPYILTQTYNEGECRVLGNLLDEDNLEDYKLEVKTHVENGTLFFPHVALVIEEDNGWSIEVWDVKAGCPLCDFGGAGIITDIKYCSGMIVGVGTKKIDDQPKIFVIFVEESKDDYSTRNFPLDMPGGRIFLTKTNIFLYRSERGSLTSQKWNFWS